MLWWALILLVVALITAALGFGGMPAPATGIAKILFFVLLVGFVASVAMGRRGGPGTPVT